MAAETFRIEIPITVEDNTDPGVGSATKKMNEFDKQAEKTKKRLDKMNKTKWQIAIEAVDKVTGVISKIGTSVKGVAGKTWSFTVSAVDKVTAPVKSMISVLGDLLGVSSAVSAILGGLTVKSALDASAESSRMLTQLQVSAKNMGIDETGIQKILDKANAIQSATMYSDYAFTGAAAELATYFEDSDAIIRMMDTVADYAAGMSGGVELSTEEIIDYTTNLAKMTTGAYDAMTKKGFEVTDAQKAILESGTDMEKVAVIESIIKENWEGMAEAMSNTPTGQMVRLKNSWGDISEMIGNKLTPGVTNFFKMLNTKMPTISKLIEGAADKAGTWLENFVPTLEGWIDTAIEKVEEFGKRASDVFSSQEFKDADFFGKIKIAWNKIIAEPFSEWWDSTGRAWFAEKMGKVGESIGIGLTQGLLALLGIDISQTIEDGTSVGGAFIEGFKKGFDTEKITEALKQWAEDNKEIVIGIGAVLGFNLITGIASKLNDLTSLFKGKSEGGGGSGGLGDLITNCTSATVNGNIVNVYGKAVNDTTSSGSGGSSLGNVLKNFLPSAAGGAVGKMLTSGGGQLLLGGGSSTVPMLTGEVAGGATAAAGGLTSATGWLGSLLQMGSSSSVIAADGTLLAVEGGVGGTLGGLGTALGSTATTAAGTAAAGVAGGAGIIGGVIGAVAGLWDIIQGTQKEGKEAKDEYFQGGSKIGLVGAGAGIGAAIGSIVPGIGTAIGAAVGAGVGGIGALFGGDGLGKWLSDATEEGGWLNTVGTAIGDFFTETIPEFFSGLWDGVTNFFTQTIPQCWNTVTGAIGTFFTETIPKAWNGFWGNIGNFFTSTIPNWWSKLKTTVTSFFTETIPAKWNELWDAVGEFFTQDIPYAIGYAVGEIEVFFTKTLPDAWNDFWGAIGNFFTNTLPSWASGIWNDHIVPFFTEDIPEFFGGIWEAISTFFTDTLPTWASGIWNDHIVPFFTVDIPEFFGGIWSAIATFFTDTLPTWASGIWNDHIVPFFTEDIPNFFSNIWDAIATFFTETLPTWASDVWNNNIVPFFTETVPNFFSDLWSGITTFFTETIPAWVSNIWNNNIVPFFTETIPNFFTQIWDSVTSFFTEAIPEFANMIWGKISGWFSSIGDWFGSVWDSVKSAFGAGYSDATGKHAWGGIMNSPHVGMVAEEGPEAIIPLSPSKSARGLDLWMKAGQLLGVKPYADGDIVGETTAISSHTATSGGGNNFEIMLEINPEFMIEGRDGMDEEAIVAIIKARIREMVDDIGDELAERLARIFANMPVKGEV